MADAHYLEEDAGGSGLGRLQQIINLTGAGVSVALVAGLGYWGYELAVRDVAGIPVVRALDTPMRIAPADPGGEIAGNLGLSVNAIAAEGAVIAPPDQLVLAPRPVELTEEDQPVVSVAAAPSVAVTGGQVASGDPVALAAPGADAGRVVPVDPVEVPTETVLAPAAEASDLPADLALDPPAALQEAPVTGTEQPLADPDSTGEPLVVEALADPVGPAPEPAPAGALVRSIRPVARPTEMVVLASLTPATAQAAPAEVAAADPATIRTGTRLVQLGAFDNADDAIAEWSRLTAQFGDLISGKTRVIQDAQSGGRNFVRLRAMGFADEADARRFCSALLSENAACIPVAQR